MFFLLIYQKMPVCTVYWVLIILIHLILYLSKAVMGLTHTQFIQWVIFYEISSSYISWIFLNLLQVLVVPAVARYNCSKFPGYKNLFFIVFPSTFSKLMSVINCSDIHVAFPLMSCIFLQIGIYNLRYHIILILRLFFYQKH